MRFVTLAALCAAGALGQSPEQTRVFTLANTQAAPQMQEIANTLRSIGEIRAVSVSPSDRTVAVSGTADQIAFASWIVAEADKPAAAPAQGVVLRDYAFPDAATPAVQVYYPSRTRTPRQLQELINTLRSIAEIQRIAAVNAHNAIFLRATPDQASLAEWLVRQAEDPAPAPVREMLMANWGGPQGAPAVRVFHPTHIAEPLELQETVNAIRSIAEVQRVVVLNEPRLIVLRGTPEQVKLAEWLVKQVDDQASGETRMAGWPSPVVRALALPILTPPQDLQEKVNRIRTLAQMQRVVGCSARPMILMRGTDEQVAAAEKLMR